MKGYGPETFGELKADVYDNAWDRPSEAVTQQSVDVLAELAAGGQVLELAVGTGRVAIPLAARGLAVHGIEASPKMVAKLREKPGGDAIGITIGNMADVGVDGAFDLVYLVFNTLFNLTSQDDQVRCFQNVSRRLTDTGLFVIEAYVPTPARYGGRGSLQTVQVTRNGVVIEASVHEPITQTVDYQYMYVSEAGVKLFPLPIRYAWPSELDLMARLAGLELRDRWGGWDRSPFTAASSSHVSVYGRAG